ncbi:uncharacterized protein YjbJ (UPF0337 family) [Salsuginibacillus halophilus]|uniref:Uncharacterized protein YjbJ (UPF0337 family) n=1 Tax=Salsuginibacillus halophilus TaxID=517424 RepID=A0A2P8HQL1_9BACI|nr:CsbD family protein [Salsuginibacillus halophilus]PSL48506.1 uncharacterized protein YjbJ (UPF0337 family) [Salsuginibacillus halophilus]
MRAEDLLGKWNRISGEAKKQWSKLTDDDIQYIEGNRDKLIGKVQERYNYSQEQAEREVDEWINKISID